MFELQLIFRSFHFRFIEKYGTHVIVGVKMGGTDIIYAKQQYSSTVPPAEVQKKLKDMADEFFIDKAGQYNSIGGRFNAKEKVWSFSSSNLFLFSLILVNAIRLHLLVMGFVNTWRGHQGLSYNYWTTSRIRVTTMS